MLIVEIKDKDGKTVKLITANPKTFKTGSRGFYGMDKAEIDGKRYQIQFQAVEIGSKTRVGGDTEERSTQDFTTPGRCSDQVATRTN